MALGLDGDGPRSRAPGGGRHFSRRSCSCRLTAWSSSHRLGLTRKPQVIGASFKEPLTVSTRELPEYVWTTEALGIHFPPYVDRVARLAAMCRTLPRLWRGESVTEPLLGMWDASLGIWLDPPPIIVGEQGGKVIEVAARWADGWNARWRTRPHMPPWSAVNRATRQLGRRHPLALGVQVFLHEVGLESARDLVRRLEDAGAETVTFVLHQERGPEWIMRLAEAVL